MQQLTKWHETERSKRLIAHPFLRAVYRTLPERSFAFDPRADKSELTELVQLNQKRLRRCATAFVAEAGGTGQRPKVPVVVSQDSHRDQLAIAQAIGKADQNVRICRLDVHIMSDPIVEMGDVRDFLLLVRISGLQQNCFQHLLCVAAQGAAAVEEAVLAWFFALHSASLRIICDEEDRCTGTDRLPSSKPARQTSNNMLNGHSNSRAAQRSEWPADQTQRPSSEGPCQVSAALNEARRRGVFNLIVCFGRHGAVSSCLTIA